MKLEIISKDVAFDTINAIQVDVTIINNVIKLASSIDIPFSDYVVTCLKDVFDENYFDCKFDDNTHCVIYIKPTKEGLYATLRQIVDSHNVEFGFTAKYFDVVEDNVEED